MILPDSTIEVAARAMVRAMEQCRNPADDCAACDALAQSKYYKSFARAALTAALPDLIEICAKVAEAAKPFMECADHFDGYPIKDATGWGIWSTTSNRADERLKQITVADLWALREAIRSLLTNPEDK